jgi:hypothetical protein
MGAGEDSGKESTSKGMLAQIGQLGPTWISAFTGVAALFIGSGYLIGLNTDGHSIAHPRVTVTKTVTMTPPSASTSKPTPSSQEAGIDVPQLGSYEVELTDGYSVLLGVTKPTQSQFDPNELSGDLAYSTYSNTQCNFGFCPLGTDQMVGLPVGSVPTFQACTSRTDFEDTANAAVGTAFCILESGVVAGVSVISLPDDGNYAILRVTIWRHS